MEQWKPRVSLAELRKSGEQLRAWPSSRSRQILESVAELFPEDAQDPDFRVLLDLATSSMRGLAMLQPVTTQDQVGHRRELIKDRLARLYEVQINVPGKESE